MSNLMEKNKMKRMILLSLVAPALAFAQAKVENRPSNLERAPIIAASHKLACGAGAQQVGGVNSNMQMLGCMKVGTEGERQFHGPMLSFYKDGKVEATGQADSGFRSGKWAFFNQAGEKVGETDFKRGDYHGKRVEYFANGAVKSEQFWVDGKRQGPQKAIDEAGKVTVQNFLDDKMVSN